MLDLTGARHGQCVSTVSGQELRYDVWIDEATGLSVRALDALLYGPTLEQLAQQERNDRLREAGFAPDAMVHCGFGFVVVRPPGKVFCGFSGGGMTGKVQFDVANAKGYMHWHGVDMKPIPSPSPNQ